MAITEKSISQIVKKLREDSNGNVQLADEIEQAHERPLKEIGKILIDIALNPDSYPQNCISAIVSIVQNELES